MLLLRPTYLWDFAAAAEETDVSCESFFSCSWRLRARCPLEGCCPWGQRTERSARAGREGTMLLGLPSPPPSPGLQGSEVGWSPSPAGSLCALISMEAKPGPGGGSGSQAGGWGWAGLPQPESEAAAEIRVTRQPCRYHPLPRHIVTWGANFRHNLTGPHCHSASSCRGSRGGDTEARPLG